MEGQEGYPGQKAKVKVRKAEGVEEAGETGQEDVHCERAML
jgi:hypothetical protein